MKILGIETSTQHASIAIVDGNTVIAEANLTDGVRHSTTLLPALDALLKAHGVGLKEICGIAVGIGPGSFTGIRLGLATARGLSLSLNIPIRGICGFDNLLAGYEGAAPRVCPLVDAHTYGFYTALYASEGRSFSRIREPLVCQPGELVKIVEGATLFMGPLLSKFKGTLAQLFGERASFDDFDRFPTAATAAGLYESPLAIRDEPPGNVAPLYLLPGVRAKSVNRRICTRNP
jgi:tRNA threonylcarbamoyladenosine biosynthesis protein TsaB